VCVSEDQITERPNVIAGQVVTERNVFLLFSGELDNGHYEAVCQLKKE
jgi:hypothetical protein